MYIKSAQTELVVMATQYMTKQGPGRAINMLCSSVTDPMTVSGTTIVGKKLHLHSRELQTLEENQENGIRP